MVQFLSFFLGLVVGTQPVELAVTGAVAHVEITLDGVAVADIHGEPWRTSVDLGTRLRPALLEAVAYHEDGRALGRDQRWLNLPRPRAQAVLLPEVDGEGAVTAVQLRWTSAEFIEPRRMRFVLDGQRIQADAALRLDVSDQDPDQTHVLEAELVFPDDVVIRKQIVFGKGHIGEVSLDLTAVPLFVENPDAFPPTDGLKGWFEVKGKPVEVVDVEKSTAQLVVVRGPSMNQDLMTLCEALRKNPDDHRDDRFPDDVTLRVIGPIASSGPRGNARLFPFSEPQLVGRKGLADALEKARFADLEFGYRRPGDAVALAGLRAATGNQRRAVLLLLGASQDDASSYPPADVRLFLSELRVPLVVFDMGDGSAAAEKWRPTENISDPKRWLSSVRWLREDLDSQRVVWIAGRHLLRDVKLTAKAHGVELLQ